MVAGKYNEVIELWEPIVKKTEFGSNSTEYVKAYQTRASVKYNSGNRDVAEGEIFYTNNKTFIVRSYVKLDGYFRIKFKNEFYRVISIDHRREYNDIEIITELVNE